MVSTKEIDPEDDISGSTMVTVPHMDDAVLGCGGTLSRLGKKDDVTIVYAADGRKMIGKPSKVDSEFDRIDINSVRKSETRNALAKLGYASGQIIFLDLPEGHLGRLRIQLAKAFEGLDINSYDHVFTPFRLDKHKDHIALSKTVMGLIRGKPHAQIWEYFVYHNWQLIKGRDIRGHIDSDSLFRVDTAPVGDLKRDALECFASQTTNFYPWMPRPVLSQELLDKYSQSPEFFLRGAPPIHDILRHHRYYELINFLEPKLKNLKERCRMVIPFK